MNPPSAGAAEPQAALLVVDDEPAAREGVCRWLEEEGHSCRAAAGADEALGCLKEHRFELMLCAVKLRGKSGVELLHLVRESWPDTAVVMLAGADERDGAVRALGLGAYGYVTKPCDRNELMISVVSALERRRMALASREYEQRLRRGLDRQKEDIRTSQEEIALRLMAASEYRDDVTGAHIRRIGLYAEAIGKALGKPKEYTETLRLAAPMHDIGKIGIPDAILLKPGNLTDPERKVMQTHTTIGGRILAGTGIPLLNLGHDIALFHHERWDGSGYPNGLAGAAIPEPARIVSVLDVYDALVHERVYREAVPEREALKVMAHGSGTQFDPQVFQSFLEALPAVRNIRKEVPLRTPRPQAWHSLLSVPFANESFLLSP